MKKIVLILSVLCCFNAVADSSEISAWQDLGQSSKNISNVLSGKDAMKQRSLILDESLLKSRLSLSNNTGTAAKATTSITLDAEISLPLPDGSMLRVKATPSNVISADMAESYPELKTWDVQGIDDPNITGVIDFTNNGFHGMLMMPDGDTIFIDPDKQQLSDVYNSFSKNENANAFGVELNCGVHDEHDYNDNYLADPAFAFKTGARALDNSTFPNVSISQRKTYRLALSATAEYTASQGGTTGARSSMVTSINRINPIFIKDFGVAFNLINDPSIIFTDSAADPFLNPADPNSLASENGNYLSDNNKLDTFDIGHVVSHSSSFIGGYANGVACIGDFNSSIGLIKGFKATAATVTSHAFTFHLTLLMHELGHQLDALHTFSSNQQECGANRNGTVAVEPGSGSSIMAFGYSCGSDNIIDGPSPRPSHESFHFASISQVNSCTRLGRCSSCGSNSAGSSVPSANAGPNVKIPANTPFLLDGIASGGTSSWDQIDIGAASAVDMDNGENAIIRHNIPTSEQDRYIPSLANLFTGTSTKGETLPTTTRDLNFAYVVRNGGVASDKKLIEVTDTGSVFSVTSQSSSQTFTTNQSTTVSWNNANTDQAPIGCSNVDIQLIRENGVKNMMLASTPNDGTQNFIVPNTVPLLSNARVLVTCSDNSFFNISSGNITVEAGVPLVDTTKPEITIIGVNPADIVEDANYIDAGATAIDNVDNSVTVTSTGSVDTNTIGTYTIRYTASDNAGNSTSATRTVNVIANPSIDNNIGDTGGGGSFGYLIMPLIILLGLRRPKPVLVRAKKNK